MIRVGLAGLYVLISLYLTESSAGGGRTEDAHFTDQETDPCFGGLASKMANERPQPHAAYLLCQRCLVCAPGQGH